MVSPFGEQFGEVTLFAARVDIAGLDRGHETNGVEPLQPVEHDPAPPPAGETSHICEVVGQDGIAAHLRQSQTGFVTEWDRAVDVSVLVGEHQPEPGLAERWIIPRLGQTDAHIADAFDGAMPERGDPVGPVLGGVEVDDLGVQLETHAASASRSLTGTPSTWASASMMSSRGFPSPPSMYLMVRRRLRSFGEGLQRHGVAWRTSRSLVPNISDAILGTCPLCHRSGLRCKIRRCIILHMAHVAPPASPDLRRLPPEGWGDRLRRARLTTSEGSRLTHIRAAAWLAAVTKRPIDHTTIGRLEKLETCPPTGGSGGTRSCCRSCTRLDPAELGLGPDDGPDGDGVEDLRRASSSTIWYCDIAAPVLSVAA